MAISERIGIIRFCETPKDKGRIMSRLGLNDVQAESYLAILTRQSMLMQNNGKYVVTTCRVKVTSLLLTELEKSKPKSYLAKILIQSTFNEIQLNYIQFSPLSLLIISFVRKTSSEITAWYILYQLDVQYRN